MRQELRLFLLAVQFLTRIPIPARVGYRAEWLNESARYFPLVGLIIGAVAAGVMWLCTQLWPATIAVGLSMASTLLLTGAFHEDGFADTCDGLGGAVSRERALEIMKDSRLGTYGVIGIVAMLAMKAATLVHLPFGIACAALPLAHGLSRTVAVTLIRWLPYAGDVEHSKAKPLSQRISTTGWIVALQWPLLCMLLLGLLQSVHNALPNPVSILAAYIAAGLMGLLCARWFQRRLGGVTGDCLGAVQQLSELSVYLVLLAWVR